MHMYLYNDDPIYNADLGTISRGLVDKTLILMVHHKLSILIFTQFYNEEELNNYVAQM